MKLKISDVELRKQAHNNPKCFSLSYCEAQNLLKFFEPIYYNSGYKLGWRYDVYLIGDMYISVGLSLPMAKLTEKQKKSLADLENDSYAMDLDAKKAYELLYNFFNAIRVARQKEKDEKLNELLTNKQ